ncbi:hypothetical protein GLOIN_2v1879824 [Rhizophagus irregularis DAOM 181602=DAOM 197198]|nr:hypothetical protein GLOIN_2v1879824 [Rhizophagus irregularis DAOM 181602=DAOM 197198]
MNSQVQISNSENNQPSLIFTHPTTFFYRPPNDCYHYQSNVQSNENESIFYYQQQYNNQFYHISCEIVSPLVINNCLSKNFLGIEFQQNMEQENLVLNFNQKENLKCYLKKYLSQYVLEIKN